MNALALSRRAQGDNAASVNWGPWADVGMASGGAVNARMGAMGLGLIDAWQGIAALEASTMKFLARKCGQDYVDQRFAWTPTLVYVDTELAARAGKKQVRVGVLHQNQSGSRNVCSGEH